MDPEDTPDPVPDAGAGASKGVVLAIAIVLLWLAGVCLFIAFEGTSFLPDQLPVGPGGKPSYFLGIMQAITGQAQQLQKQGVKKTDSSGG